MKTSDFPAAGALTERNPYESEDLRLVLGEALRPGGLELTREAVEWCAFPPGARLLDLGCGPGATLKFLRDRGFDALGLDISPALAAEARAHGPVLAADFHHPPLEDDSLDGIFCECVLSLADDQPRVLAECARMLKPGGRLVISDLVRREPGGPADEKQGAGCAAGAVSADVLAARLGRAGFRVMHQSDHGRALAELAARLVWRCGSAEILRRLWGVGGSGGFSPRAFSYIFIIAGRVR